jgi:hypothetical protein
MAVVYAATHRNRKRFAVKVLHASCLPGGISALDFFERVESGCASA